VERALLRDPGIVYKEKCDTKRIRGVEQVEKLEQPKISRDETLQQLSRDRGNSLSVHIRAHAIDNSLFALNKNNFI